MSISVSNTTLNNSFETWRLNTNEIATILSNNVVTVARAGSADRQAYTVGNGHIVGTFSANEFRTTTLKAGNTSNDGAWLYVLSNTSINAHTLTITSNTIFQGNVNFNTVGSDRVHLGDISRIIVNGGTKGQFLRLANQNDNLEFKTLTMTDIRPDAVLSPGGLVINHANLIFTAQSATTDSTQAVWTNGQDRVIMFMAPDATVGDSDLYLGLADSEGDSRFVITNNSNTIVGYITSEGDADFEGRITAVGFTAQDTILPSADDQIDLGSSGAEFKDAYIDGVAYIDELSLGTAASQGVSTSMIPKTNDTYNFGSATRRWKNSYFTGQMQANVISARSVGIGGALTANGLASLSNTTVTQLNANNEVYFHGNLAVDGISSLSNTTVTKLTANNEALFKSSITVHGVSNLSNTTVTLLTANNNATFDGDRVTVTGNTHLQDQLFVANTTNLSGNVVIGGHGDSIITIEGRIANQHTTGPATFRSEASGGGVGIGGAVTSGYDLTVHGDANIKTDLDIDGNVTIDGDLTLSATSNFTVPSGAVLTADDQRVTNIRVSGNTFLGDASTDDVTINGTVISDILVETGKRHNLGSTTASWQNVYGNNVIVGQTVTTKHLNASGNLDIAGNTDVSGAITNDGTTLFGNNGKLHANNVIQNGNITTNMLANTAIASKFDGTNGVENPSVTSGTFGSGSLVPVITVNNKGQITAVTNTAVAGVSTFSYASVFRNFTIGTADGGVFVANIAHQSLYANAMATPLDPDGNALTTHFDVSGASNGYMVYGSATRVPVITVNRAGQVIEVANVDVAGVSGLSFDTANGHLRISTADGSEFDTNITGHIRENVVGTAKEITVSSSTANTWTIGLPDDVTITSDLMVGGGVFVTGNLYVQGSTTQINTSTLTVDDNIITLNNDVSGVAPTQDSGIEIKRGINKTQRFIWNETDDRWNAKDVDGTWQIIEANKVYALANNATVLETPRAFAMTGDVVASAVNFDGSGNVTLTGAIQADTISSTELLNETRLRILNASGTTLKTLWGAGS